MTIDYRTDNRLMQVESDNIVGLEFVRDRAVAYAADHGCQRFALLDEIFVADRVVETFPDGNIREFHTAAGGRRRHDSASISHTAAPRSFPPSMEITCARDIMGLKLLAVHDLPS